MSAVQRHRVRPFAREGAEVRPRGHDLAEEMRGQLEARGEPAIPAARRGVDELGRGRVGVFGDGAPGQPMVHEVRHEQEPASGGGQALAPMRVELEQGVEVEELDAGAAEDLRPRNALEDTGGNPRRAHVAIADGVLDQPPVVVEESVVHAPAVDAEALHRTPELARARSRRPQARVDLGEDPRRVPAQVARHFARRVLEPPHLVEQKLSRRHAGEEHAPAPGAEVYGDEQRVRVLCAQRSVSSLRRGGFMTRRAR